MNKNVIARAVNKGYSSLIVPIKEREYISENNNISLKYMLFETKSDALRQII